MRAVDPRLLRQAGAARGYLAVVVLLLTHLDRQLPWGNGA